jgi:hypothetical protein
MELPSNEAPFDHAQIQERSDERKDEGGLEDVMDAADVADAFDACRPGFLDLGCFDVPDCGGGLDCVPLDCGF